MHAALGILVRSEPYDRRVGRERLDPALAAASLDIPIAVFFVGDGVLHLLPQQQAQNLPASPFTRGWAALEDLSDQVELFAESSALERVSGSASELQTRVQILDRDAIARKMRNCRAVIHV